MPLNFLCGTAFKEVLEKQIGQMIVLGFDEAKIDSNSAIVQAIQRYDLGGVILFDRFYDDKAKVKILSHRNNFKP